MFVLCAIRWSKDASQNSSENVVPEKFRSLIVSTTQVPRWHLRDPFRDTSESIQALGSS